MKNRQINIFLIFVILIFSSCTSLKENSNATNNKTSIEQIENTNLKEASKLEKYFGSDTDPWEGFNRRVYNFNYNVDKYALTPAVKTYKFITPVFVQDRVTNFFRNIKGISITANSAAQFKGRKAMRSLA
ncbi:MlaA family lipoprotein, partial [Fusobacterium sp.]|uniref:MlaA family lipoprotein n=1 Tax=Fusobacterium sp. TaxID=68766 RepID=UPI0025C09B5B